MLLLDVYVYDTYHMSIVRLKGMNKTELNWIKYTSLTVRHIQVVTWDHFVLFSFVYWW
jgi:hypothetical protein